MRRLRLPAVLAVSAAPAAGSCTRHTPIHQSSSHDCVACNICNTYPVPQGGSRAWNCRDDLLQLCHTEYTGHHTYMPSPHTCHTGRTIHRTRWRQVQISSRKHRISFSALLSGNRDLRVTVGTFVRTAKMKVGRSRRASLPLHQHHSAIAPSHTAILNTMQRCSAVHGARLLLTPGV
jgi:hypothetical protein